MDGLREGEASRERGAKRNSETDTLVPNTMTTVDSYTDIAIEQSTYLSDQFRNLLRTKHIIRTPYG